MAEEIEAEEAERLLDAVCRVRWDRDAALREFGSLCTELENVRFTLDRIVQEGREALQRLTPVVADKENPHG